MLATAEPALAAEPHGLMLINGRFARICSARRFGYGSFNVRGSGLIGLRVRCRAKNRRLQ